MFAANESFIMMEDDDSFGMSSFRINKFAPITPILNTTREEVFFEDSTAKVKEIQALVARTENALCRIVTIRKSMESLVDFDQFQANRKVAKSGSKKLTLRRQDSSSSEASTIGSCDTRDTAMMYARDTSLLEDARSFVDDLHLPVPSSISIKHTSYSMIDMCTSKDSMQSLLPSSCVSTEFSESGSSDTILRGLLASYDSGSALVLKSTGEAETPGLIADRTHLNGSNEAMDSMHYDEDRFSCFSSLSLCDEEISNSFHKEKRLERLQDIEISFIEGYSKEFYTTMARFLQATIETKRHHVRLSFFKDTFCGHDCILRLFADGFADNQLIALRFGQTLMRLGYIEHVDHRIKVLRNSREDFYRFSRRFKRRGSECKQSRESIKAAHYRECVIAQELMICDNYDFDQASDQVHALVTEECLDILGRLLRRLLTQRNKLLSYKGLDYCFLGAEAVNVLQHSDIATSTLDAILIGQALFDEAIVESVAENVTSFQDKYIFYRFLAGAT
uniref:Uncharacterized protein AlNc14C18G1923 n=1 Tax=Albugo laibachii Nc14 TaxID=890382 RepID=F0W4V3_9STRA|nr:conserved hypothetical protein [Albugo laibachii Nc14]CCA25102.1 conserved hypothetical protein [Albugo laibachii Nc14]|eukprot:CCA25102.1 conserved hypothetical protein [Albugo laibachii Nc14]